MADRLRWLAGDIDKLVLEAYIEIDRTPRDEDPDPGLCEAYQLLSRAQTALLDARNRLMVWQDKRTQQAAEMDRLRATNVGETDVTDLDLLAPANVFSTEPNSRYIDPVALQGFPDGVDDVTGLARGIYRDTDQT